MRSLSTTIQRAVFTCALAVNASGIAQSALAKQKFDGSWSVLIITDAGSCERSYRFGVEINNGRVAYSGSGVNVAGQVTPQGQVSVRVQQGEQLAIGKGRLAGEAGSGTWSGSTLDQKCTGRWTAERREF